jgi:starch synthase
MGRAALRRSGIVPLEAAAAHPGSGLTIVHVGAEYWPVAQVGGLAEALHGLARAQQRAGARVIAIVPFYRQVRQAGLSLEPGGVECAGQGPAEGRVRWWRWARPAEPEVWFVDHPWFDRAGIYGEGGGEYGDNGERFALLSRAAVCLLGEAAPSGPVVLHAHDWHGALALVYLRATRWLDASPQPVAGVLSVHNAAFQGQFPAELVAAVGLPAEVYEPRGLEWYGRANWLKGGLAYADAVVTVSPTHARELVTEAGGFGLHQTFASLGERLTGILNGIDVESWNPARDPSIPARYSAARLEGKRACKRALQRALGLAAGERIPLAVMSTRLVWQKGLDLILDGLAERFDGLQLVFLGRGEPRYEAALASLAARFPGRVVLDREFSEAQERRLLAGADILLMPSFYEPCGLTQMRAQRYGVLPVARRVGGLADTIDPEVGFLFDDPTAAALAGALARALAAYGREREWTARVRRAMGRDFSWSGPVRQYLDLYRRILAGLGLRPAARPRRRSGVLRPRAVRPARRIRLEETGAGRFT